MTGSVSAGKCKVNMLLYVMPQNIVQKISVDVRKALADAGVKEKLQALGNDTMDMPPDEFAKFVRDEMAVYQQIVKAAGIKPQ